MENKMSESRMIKRVAVGGGREERRGKYGNSPSHPMRMMMMVVFFVLVLFVSFIPSPSLQIVEWKRCTIGKDGTMPHQPCNLNIYLGQTAIIDCGKAPDKIEPPLTDPTHPQFCKTPLSGPTAICTVPEALPTAVGVSYPNLVDMNMIISATSKRTPSFSAPYSLYGRCSGESKIMYFGVTIYPVLMLNPYTRECAYEDTVSTGTNFTALSPCHTMTFEGEEANVTCMSSPTFEPTNANKQDGKVCLKTFGVPDYQKCLSLELVSWDQLMTGVVVTSTTNGYSVKQPKDLATDKTAAVKCSNGSKEMFVNNHFNVGKRPGKIAFELPANKDGYKTHWCSKGVCTGTVKVGDSIIINCTGAKKMIPSSLTDSARPTFCRTSTLYQRSCTPENTIPWSFLGDPIIDRFGAYAGVTITAAKQVHQATTVYGGCEQEGVFISTDLSYDLEPKAPEGKNAAFGRIFPFSSLNSSSLFVSSLTILSFIFAQSISFF